MDGRKIELFTDGEQTIKRKNRRDLVTGIILFFVMFSMAAIFARRDIFGKFTFGIVGDFFICAGVVFIVLALVRIFMRNDEYSKACTNKSIAALINRYGEYSIKIDDVSIDHMTFLFPSSQVVVIQGMVFKFSEIIDFSLNEMASYKTTTSTSSMLGRGVVGGMMFGGIGALVGANSASSKTVKENIQYNFNIILDDFKCPNVRCTYSQYEQAMSLYSILTLIIDKNQSREGKEE